MRKYAYKDSNVELLTKNGTVATGRQIAVASHRHARLLADNRFPAGSWDDPVWPDVEAWINDKLSLIHI